MPFERASADNNCQLRQEDDISLAKTGVAVEKLFRRLSPENSTR
jgi:hypothetical protein